MNAIAQQTSDPFHARHYPEHFNYLQEKLAEHPDLLPYEEKIVENARLAIGFKAIAVDDYSQKGNTRFFGLPDLPPNLEYPKIDPKSEENEGNYWKFIAQINFSELKGICDYLPESGILYFFIGSQYDDIGEPVDGNKFVKSQYKCHKVLFYDGETEDLVSAKELNIEPNFIFDVYLGDEDEEGTDPAKVDIFPVVAIANYEHFHEPALYPTYPPLIGENMYVKIRQFNYALCAEKGFYNSAINGSVQNVYHGSPYTQAAKVLGGKPEDYVLLLQVTGSSEYNGYHFGDADTLYFVISKENLKKRDFSEVYCTTTWWWGEFGSYYD